MCLVLAVGLAFFFGYLAGSIPSGVIISRFGGAVDPRTIGSGNIGATNVLRSGRKGLAALTLICDALKGTAAVLVAAHFDTGQGPVALALVAAGAAFLGHLYPVFLHFKGGKGVATFLGCLIALAWPAALAFAGIWLAVVAATRFSSAAALAASAATPAVLFALGHHGAALLYLGLAIVLWIKHHENIRRLLAGTESKVGAKS
jgi:glycerol-3-phosphate acyltransferase PlsY